MNPRCLMLTPEAAWARRWLAGLKARGWHAERVAEKEVAARTRAGWGILLVDPRLGREEASAFVAALRRLAPGWRIVLVAPGREPRALGRGLVSGADDLLWAGLPEAALAARLSRLSRAPVLGLADGAIRLDRDARCAWCGARRPRLLDLTPTEFEILAMLLEGEGRPVARRDLIERVWRDAEVNGEAVDRHVGSLRGKLGSHGGRIRTERGIGYAAC